MKKEMKWARFASAMSSAALVKVVAVVSGWWIGTRLDAWLGTKPWLMLVCFMAGAALGFWYLIYVLEKYRPK